MEISTILAKILGFYLLIVSLILLLRFNTLKPIMKQFTEFPPIIIVTGVISLLIGITILVIHPFWQWQWPLVITLLGVIMLLQGIIRIACPACLARSVNAFVNKRGIYVTCLLITFLIGIYLIYHAFH